MPSWKSGWDLAISVTQKTSRKVDDMHTPVPGGTSNPRPWVEPPLVTLKRGLTSGVPIDPSETPKLSSDNQMGP